MDMKSSKHWREHVREEHRNPRSVKFCKIMVGDFSQRMSVPRKLMGWFKELSEETEIIDLMGPSGNKWHVGLGKSTAGSVFLQYGWKEFVEDHCLEENDVLIFNYEGDSCFSVLIYDSSECERESSYFVKKEHLEKQDATEEYFLKMAEDPAAASEGFHNAGNIPKKSSPSVGDKRGESSCPRSGTQKKRDAVDAGRLATDAELDAAMHAARAFTTTRPLFLTVMKGYNVSDENGQFQLLVPADFAREFLPQESQDIFLRVENAKNEWKVAYGVGKSLYRFVGKWRNFARENNLNVGDVCVFELSRGRKRIAMMVHIFRALNTATASAW